MGGYITCPKCGEKVYEKDGKYFCRKCNKEIKPKPSRAWGN
jgi:uncharacterized Zn finger protein (UPF0148 family)